MKYIIIFLLLSLSAAGQQEFFHAQNKGLLLDEYPNAAAAYSLRRVNSRYTGPLIRVRRDSTGQAEQDIGSLGEALDTVALKAFVRTNSGYVTTWYDQSGNARNATQTTAASQPRIVSAGVVDYLNGKPAMFFDGSNDFLEVPSSTATFKFLHDGTKSFVTFLGRAGIINDPQLTYGLIDNLGGSSANTGFSLYFSDAPPNNNRIINLVGRSETGQPTLQSVSDNVFTSNAQVLATIKLDLANDITAEKNSIKINGGSELKTNTSTRTPSTANATFNLKFGIINTVLPLLGNIQESIFYASDQTTTRTQIETNINQYYAIY